MTPANITAKERREDYALRYVPERFRIWHWSSIFSVFVGVSTAMFFLAWGGELTLAYGTWPTIWGMVFGVVLIGSIGFFFSWIGSRTGLDSDLITRGSGYGFMGSAIASLVYSFNYLMFFAFEGSILVAALQGEWPHVPTLAWELMIGATFLVLAIWGMTFLSWLMWITLPIYLVAVAVVVSAAAHVSHPASWLSYHPVHPPSTASGPIFLQLGATVFALISMATQGADLGRFVRKQDRLVGSIFNGYVFTIVSFLGVVLLGSYLGVEFHNTNPGTYFSQVLGVGGVLTVVITQLRINTINVYSGSLAYSNFFSRVFHFTPGRYWWGILTAVLGTLLMMGNLFTHMLQVLTFEGVFIIAWAMSVVSDTIFNKWWLKINQADYEYKRAFLPRFNPIGVGSLLLALIVAVPLAFGAAGPIGVSWAPFVSALGGLIWPPIIALGVKGRPYQVASSATLPEPDAAHQCVKCHLEFEGVDMVVCPFHQGPLCSVCCGAEAHCHDVCKQPDQLISLTLSQELQ